VRQHDHGVLAGLVLVGREGPAKHRAGAQHLQAARRHPQPADPLGLAVAGESEVASRKNPDGTVSFLTTIPGFDGLEFVVGAGSDKRTLVFRDAQHEYTFTEK
jgi:hypothetical protein